MTAQRQPQPSPAAPVCLCSRCRAELACPRCDRPELAQPLPPARLALSLRETATALGVSVETIRAWELEWALPVVRVERVVRVPVAALEAWLARGGRP